MAQAHSHSPAELKAQIEAERTGHPFLVWRGAEDAQVVEILDGTVSRLTVGRSPDAAVSLAHDHEVSRLHAELELISGAWTLTDDGLSRNGSFVNGERVTGRTRLRNADVMRFGNTQVTFRSPDGMTVDETHIAGDGGHAGRSRRERSTGSVQLDARQGAGFCRLRGNRRVRTPRKFQGMRRTSPVLRDLVLRSPPPLMLLV